MAGNKSNGENDILTGAITPGEWDGGPATAVALYAIEDEAYRVENRYNLFDLTQQCI